MSNQNPSSILKLFGFPLVEHDDLPPATPDGGGGDDTNSDYDRKFRCQFCHRTTTSPPPPPPPSHSDRRHFTQAFFPANIGGGHRGYRFLPRSENGYFTAAYGGVSAGSGRWMFGNSGEGGEKGSTDDVGVVDLHLKLSPSGL
ncbi:hypothetical protein SDJN03_12700, partial [Cucurbita argyrosperma subsp. sororia]